MNLDQLKLSGRIIASMRSRGHWDSICELVDFLVAKEAFPEASKDELLSAFQKREEECSTGFGGGIAIPHVYSGHVDEVVPAFGRLEEGIEFGAIDNAPVRFVFLLIVPEAQYNLHLKVLSNIARFLSNAEVYRSLSQAKDEPGLFEVLSGKTITET